MTDKVVERSRRPVGFSSFGEDDDIEIIRDTPNAFGDDSSLEMDDDYVPDDSNDIDDLDETLVSPLCCFGAGGACFLFGLICVIVVGSFKASDSNGEAEEIRDITLILMGLGIPPAFFFFLFCVCGVGLFVRQRRKRRYIQPGDVETFVSQDMDLYEDEEEEDDDGVLGVF